MIGKTRPENMDKNYIYCEDCLYGGNTTICTAPAGVLKSCTETMNRMHSDRHWKDWKGNPNQKDSRTWEPL